MKQILADYCIILDASTVYCDNHNAINISKNLVEHSNTKHIDICHHFIMYLIESKTIVLKNNLLIFSPNPLIFFRFDSLRKSLGMCSFYFACFLSYHSRILLLIILYLIVLGKFQGLEKDWFIPFIN